MILWWRHRGVYVGGRFRICCPPFSCVSSSVNCCGGGIVKCWSSCLRRIKHVATPGRFGLPPAACQLTFEQPCPLTASLNAEVQAGPPPRPRRHIAAAGGRLRAAAGDVCAAREMCCRVFITAVPSHVLLLNQSRPAHSCLSPPFCWASCTAQYSRPAFLPSSLVPAVPAGHLGRG